jgi:DnaJ-domain-containing protein 1
MNPRDASTCLKCGELHHSEPKKTFFGFQKVSCETCGHLSLYPLTNSYNRYYWIGVFFLYAVVIIWLTNPLTKVPGGVWGILGLFGPFVLWKDRRIYKDVINQIVLQVSNESKRSEEARRRRAEEQRTEEKAGRRRAEEQQKEKGADKEQSTDSSKDSELVKCGKILGLAGKMTPRDINKKYRELMTQYHPDKVSKLGPKLREVAEAESKKINEAYDYFRKKYDF